MNRWLCKAKAALTLEDIAKAHAYFIVIHPFGDDNGRVGRAMVYGRYAPLIRLFNEAAQRG